MDVTVRRYSEEDGLYELLVAGAAAQVDDWADVVEGSVVEARITGANTGGLECKVGSLRGFIPSSQIAVFRVEDYAEFIDQKLLCVVTEVNPRRMNLVLSRRAVLEREKEAAREQLLKSLEVGQVMDGVVRKILDFGAFVDIGGVDGLVHISQLSWDHVKHPSEVLQEGQKIRVKIEKIDPQTGKIGLSYRELLEHPWLHIDEKFHADSVVAGTVSRIAKFGAFVKLAPGIEGLIHISELSHARVPSVGSVVAEGQEVQVKILSLDSESQRIALSMKAVLPMPVAEEAAPEKEEAPEEPRDPAVARRNVPLRGGMDRATGGDQFGLKW
jgi:small subunit ribosomal protein S1